MVRHSAPHSSGNAPQQDRFQIRALEQSELDSIQVGGLQSENYITTKLVYLGFSDYKFNICVYVTTLETS